MKSAKTNLSNHTILIIGLLIFGLAFFSKGWTYLIIGSYLPFALSIVYASLVAYVICHLNRTSRRIIRFVGVLLILWGFSRLSIEAMFAIVSVTEAHIQGQFTIEEKVISLAAVLTGVYTLYYAKKYVLKPKLGR